MAKVVSLKLISNKRKIDPRKAKEGYMNIIIQKKFTVGVTILFLICGLAIQCSNNNNNKASDPSTNEVEPILPCADTEGHTGFLVNELCLTDGGEKPPAPCKNGEGIEKSCKSCEADFTLHNGSCLSSKRVERPFIPHCRDSSGSEGVCKACDAGFALSAGSCLLQITFIFDLNGATAGKLPEWQTATAGSTIVVPTVQGTFKAGHIFLGWSTVKDTVDANNWLIAGTVYKIGRDVTIRASTLTFYATWGKTYTVSYNLNGGIGLVEDLVSYPAGTAITVRSIGSAILPPSAIRFFGWAPYHESVDNLGSGSVVFPGQSKVFFSDISLYALWYYPISYDCNDGTPSGSFPTWSSARVGASLHDLEKKGCVSSNPNYALEGWSTTGSLPLQRFMPNGSLALKAVFLPKVDIDGNGLIEISSAEQLNNIRYNLRGTSYVNNAGLGLSGGCPDRVCKGYELVNDIDFATTKWGSAYKGVDKVAEGWEPIGGGDIDCSYYLVCVRGGFQAIFEGRGFVIRNLYINRPNLDGVGLFSNMGEHSILNEVAIEGAWIKGRDVVGGLLGYSDIATIKNSYTKGTVIGNDGTGGLVGGMYASIIKDSYFTGFVEGRSYVGGLVGGWMEDGSIIQNSYAQGTLTASGGWSIYSGLGGLVGSMRSSSIIKNSYFIGSVECAGSDNVGGLAGGLYFSSEIENSYAEGSIVTTAERHFSIGGLVGDYEDSSIKKSYTTSRLVFNYGYNVHIGALVGFAYGDYSIIKDTYWDIQTVSFGEAVSHDDRRYIDNVTGLRTSQMQAVRGDYPSALGNCFKFSNGRYPKLYSMGEDGKCTTNLLFGPNSIETYVPDIDGNGLIEISSAEQLNNIRYNLEGTSWKTNSTDIGLSSGCPNGVCRGYELVANIDFETTRWGSAYKGIDKVADGLEPIGKCAGPFNNCGFDTDEPFVATLEGNGFMIQNLYINPSIAKQGIGLFGIISKSAYINRVGLNEAWVKGLGNYIGALVGYQNAGSVANSYVRNGVISGSNTHNYVGGLIGFQNSGSVRSSYTTGVVMGNTYVGGLVGGANHVFSSYSMSAVSGQSTIGGLVGRKLGGISNSYATGAISGNSHLGGLVGQNSSFNNIVGSYWDTQATGTNLGVAVGDSVGATGLTTSNMQEVDSDYPSQLGVCFKLTKNRYPQVYTSLNDLCTATLMDGSVNQ